MLTEEEILTGSMIYILLLSIDPQETAGKNARKKISRAIKKDLAIHVSGCKSKDRYLFLVNRAHELIYEARDEMQEEDLRTDPGAIISTLMNRWPEMMKGFDIPTEKVAELNGDDKSSGTYAGKSEYWKNEYGKVSNRLNSSFDKVQPHSLR